jgi:hypothetical protein
MSGKRPSGDGLGHLLLRKVEGSTSGGNTEGNSEGIFIMSAGEIEPPCSLLQSLDRSQAPSDNASRLDLDWGSKYGFSPTEHTRSPALAAA